MKLRHNFRILIALGILSLLTLGPAAAKGMPTFFTVEGGELPAPIPFTHDVNPTLGVMGVMDLESMFEAEAKNLGDYYVIRSYTMVAAGVGGAETGFIESLLSPMHYYRQDDGPGMIQYIGPENVSSEWDKHFFMLTDEMDQAVRKSIELGGWYQLVAQAD